MTQQLRFIQVGTGGFGGYWCSKVLPAIVHELGAARLVAAVDINPQAHQNIISNVGIDPSRCYTDLRQALEENPCDFVVIVLPAHLHEYAVDLALEFECDILMEKPVSDSMESSCRVYRKVKRAGRKLAVTYSHRFDQDKQTLQQYVQSGLYGRLHYLIGRFTSNNRSAVNDPREYAHHHYLISSAVHQFDIIRSITGSNAKTVYTQSWNPQWAPFKEHSTALVQMEMENGVRVFFEGSKSNATQLNGWSNDYFRAECEFGTLELDRRKLVARSDLGFPHPRTAELPLLEQKHWTHTWLMKMFIDWVNGGEAPPNHLEDNMQCTALQYAAIESGLTGKLVDVQQFLQQHLGRVQQV
ncbi:Gfo/Idh/MocA family protein [Paenibacillus thalictri]|uniref:Gfo/Idh/MocA family oxidoreductase n=1 Tax=Paenibacillus thalictri TaxID=2527873 RepID=A0A4Q9DMF6_9BACL|nr:Gfo/Idh/MocA family oxidoreductase [Paenibacillus thalictri]TBL76520.1 Gfo/Idh/MocA family oxidoreductase [Paenibacillus thalictri]